ncbi:MAG: DnaB-like helicase C-terminal domain-containing protein [Chloroflexota bacterium]|nr:DnaB-like helicase C-terminal domain-containing protein [Chloroflexota bacterium]
MADVFNNPTAEKRVLAGLLADDDILDQVINTIDYADFNTDRHRYMFDIISRFYHKYYKRIERNILDAWLTKNDATNKTDILLLYGELHLLGSDKYIKFYIDELKECAAKRKLYDVYKEIGNGLENDLDPNKMAVSITQQMLTTNTSSIVERTSVFDDPDDRIHLYIDKEEHPERYKGVQYGIKEIDELTGGMFTGQLYLIVGRSGAGKSRALFNIGCNVAKTGKKVMYCTIEMDAKILQNMWESREAKIPLTDIMRTQLTGYNRRKYLAFLQHQKKVQHPLYIVDIPQGCTTGLIESEILAFEKIHGQAPDLVLIDYANLIRPMAKYKDRAEMYDHVFRELKEGSRAHKTIYYTAAQMNRESLKASKVGTEHIAFSDASSYHCDSIFRIFADEKDEVNHEVHFEVIKGRYHQGASIDLCWKRDINWIGSWSNLVKPITGSKDESQNVSGSAATNAANVSDTGRSSEDTDSIDY